MYSIDDITSVDIETTNRCNASCPLCLRTNGLETDNVLNWDRVIDAIPKTTWRQIKTFNFNGTTGDNFMHPDIKEIIQWMVNHTNGVLNFHTNGSMRSTRWWGELGTVLKDTDHKIVFGIDGLEDTHKLYRIGTNFKKIIKNAVAFIENGGNAHWQFILFQHNQHQVDQAKELAYQLGFKNFFTLYQDRFDETGEITANLSNKIVIPIKKIDFDDAPKGTVIRTSSTNIREKIKNFENVIECKSKKVGWVSIYADGTVWPCCWLMGWHKASGQGIYYDVVNYHFKKFLNIDFSKISLYNNSLEDILNQDFYKTKLEESFKNTVNPICIQQCSKSKISQ